MSAPRWQASRYLIITALTWLPFLAGSFWWNRHANLPITTGLQIAWCLNLINCLAVALINRYSFSRSTNRFLAWTLIGNGTRMGVLVIAILVVYKQLPDQFAVFLSVLLVGYFLSLFIEIYFLQTLSLAADRHCPSATDTAQAE